MGQFLSKARVPNKSTSYQATAIAKGALRDKQQEEFLRRRRDQFLRRQQRTPEQGQGLPPVGSGVLQPQQQQQQQQPGVGMEMPPDLLQFLKDAGPLQQKLSKEQTSSRLIEVHANETDKEAGETEKKLKKEAESRRERRDMRLVGNIEGFTSTKTTNFYNTPDVVDNKDFGLADLDIYKLLRSLQVERQQDASNAVVENTGEAALVQSFYDDYINKMESSTGTNAGDTASGNDTSNASSKWTQEEQEYHQQLLKNAIRHIELPIILQDDDGDYVGVTEKYLKDIANILPSTSKKTNGDASNNIQKQVSPTMNIVDETKVKLVLEDMVEKSKPRFGKNRRAIASS